MYLCFTLLVVFSEFRRAVSYIHNGIISLGTGNEIVSIILIQRWLISWHHTDITQGTSLSEKNKFV